MSTEPQRYDLGYDVREGRDVIEQHDAGDYVLFSDYEALRLNLQSEIEEKNLMIESLEGEIFGLLEK